MLEIFILLVAFQVKHFICDYPLQNSYMLQKGNKDNWIIPLFTHSLVHSIGTFIIVCFISIKLAFILALLDLVLHFTVDRIKATQKFSIDNPYFWWALGLDQMAHHLINILFIYIILIGVI